MKSKIILGAISLLLSVALTGCASNGETSAKTNLSSQLDKTNNSIATVKSVSMSDVNVDDEKLSAITDEAKCQSLKNSLMRTQDTLQAEEYYKNEILGKTAVIKKYLQKEDLKLAKGELNALKDLTANLSNYNDNVARSSNEFNSTYRNYNTMKRGVARNVERVNAKLNKIACNSNMRCAYYINILNTLQNIEEVLGIDDAEYYNSLRENFTDGTYNGEFIFDEELDNNTSDNNIADNGNTIYNNTIKNGSTTDNTSDNGNDTNNNSNNNNNTNTPSTEVKKTKKRFLPKNIDTYKDVDNDSADNLNDVDGNTEDLANNNIDTYGPFRRNIDTYRPYGTGIYGANGYYGNYGGGYYGAPYAGGPYSGGFNGMYGGGYNGMYGRGYGAFGRTYGSNNFNRLAQPVLADSNSGATAENLDQKDVETEYLNKNTAMVDDKTSVENTAPHAKLDNSTSLKEISGTSPRETNNASHEKVDNPDEKKDDSTSHNNLNDDAIKSSELASKIKSVSAQKVEEIDDNDERVVAF